MQVGCGPIHQKGHCDGCGGLLPRGRRAWCSNACETRIVENHVWGVARYAALKRDGHKCVICGNDDQCARAKEWHHDQGKTFLEVNHIHPVNGRRKNVDCQNHLSNLETLCHDCHNAITRQQREDGLIGRTRRHIWKAQRVSGMGFVQCARCGRVDTSVHIGPNTKVGTNIWRGNRLHEECAGPLMKDLPRRRKKR